MTIGNAIHCHCSLTPSLIRVLPPFPNNIYVANVSLLCLIVTEAKWVYVKLTKQVALSLANHPPSSPLPPPNNEHFHALKALSKNISRTPNETMAKNNGLRMASLRNTPRNTPKAKKKSYKIKEKEI